MTDRHGGYIIVLENDIREDDAEPIINAIKQIRGVIEVAPCVSDSGTWIAHSRARHEILMKFSDFMIKELKK